MNDIGERQGEKTDILKYMNVKITCLSMLLIVSPILAADSQEIQILFCGDLMIHKGVKKSARASNVLDGKGNTSNFGGFYGSFSDLKKLTSKAHISFCNFEAPLVYPPPSDPYCFKTKGAFFFKAPQVVAKAVKWAGFDIVSIANNHIDNAGIEGIESTLEILKKNNIAAVGGGLSYDEAHDPVVITAGGYKVAFIAYCSSLLGENPNSADKSKVHICRVDPRDTSVKELFSDISYAKSIADVVVLSFHWGPKEYRYSPSESVQKLAYRCAEAGVSVVAGHHPHVVQKSEYYTCKDGRKSFIMWSLGNLISNQAPAYKGFDGTISRSSKAHKDENKSRRREGAAILVSIGVHSQVQSTANSSGSFKQTVDVCNASYAPLWTENNFLQHLDGNEELSIKVVSIDHEIERLKQKIAFLRERKKRISLSLSGGLEKYNMMQSSPSNP